MEAASVLLELEVQEDFLTVREAGVVVVEVLAVMELEVWRTLQSAVEEEVSGGAAGARILSSVVGVGVGAGPRPGLAAAGSLVAVSTDQSSVGIGLVNQLKNLTFPVTSLC